MTTEHHDPEPIYEVRIAGRLADRWSAWFDGLTVASDADGTTVLRGRLPDQAALHGLLQKLRDAGIPLLSLSRVPSADPTDPNEPTAHPIHQEN